MSDPLDFEFMYNGHLVQVRRIHVPDNWLGDHDTLVMVRIDGSRIRIPDLLNAYQTAGAMGVKLVICAFIDGGSTLPRASVIARHGALR